jgi:hypothetical protein
VVEHSIGNGEVDSSILSGSTSFPLQNNGLDNNPLPVPPRLNRERKSNLPQTQGENPGTLFAECSTESLRVRRLTRIHHLSYSLAEALAHLAFGVAR